MDILRWGVLGTGTIAAKMAKALQQVEGAVLQGVGSRTVEKAKAFAQKYSAAESFGSYEELCESDEIDIIYVATPHCFHRDHTLMALNHGKHVLCEKPFALNLAEAQEMINAARQKKLFLMEAMWTCVMPGLHKLKSLIDEGKIGTPGIVEADFGFQGDRNPHSRLLNPALGGGALLDVGVYPLSLGMFLFGKPLSYNGTAYVGPTGVDESGSYTVLFKNGVLGRFSSSIGVKTSCSATIFGTEGKIGIPADFWHYEKLQIENGEAQELLIPHNGSEYAYEVQEVCNSINKGLIESPVISWQWSLDMMELLDGIRKQTGVIYPSDCSAK